MFKNQNLIIDTSVLINSPQSIHQFTDCNIFLTLEVLEELDKLKVKNEKVGKSARYVNRFLDEIRENQSLITGAKIENGSVIYVVNGKGKLHPSLEEVSNDNKIISIAVKLQAEIGEVIVLTNDIAFRLKCDSLGLKAFGYDPLAKKEKVEEKYSGTRLVEISRSEIDMFYNDGLLNFPEYSFLPNECVILRSGKASTLGVANNETEIRALKYAVGDNSKIEGIKPRSHEQTFALEMLLNPEISLLTLSGRSGTGKTILTIAAGMKGLHEGLYDKILLSRPVESTSKSLGFLPGPQPLDAKVLTPTGWITMGEIKIGDFVISRDGYPTKVLGVYPKGEKDIYRVTTTDGTSTECCEDHLWLTQTHENRKRKKPGSIKTTRQIMETIHKYDGHINHYLPRNDAVNFSKVSLPIPPYTLGALIGDGSFSGITGNSHISIYGTDIELINRVNVELQTIGCIFANKKNRNTSDISYEIKNIETPYNNKPGRIVRITNLEDNTEIRYNSIGIALKNINLNRSTLNSRCNNKRIINGNKYEFIDKDIRWTNKLKEELSKLGLLGRRSYDKFIPEKYKFSAIEDRISILRGLLDTDGTIKDNGEASFTTTSRQLANDVQEIVRSLGGRATVISRDQIGKHISLINGKKITKKHITYEFTVSLPQHINPFYISRKARKHKCKYIYMPRIESITYVGKKEAQCILIDNDEHLYITDDYIVTHNTAEEKMAPWLQPIFDNLNLLYSRSKSDLYIEKMLHNKKIEVAPLSYIRGRSLPRTFFMVDEAQNITYHEAKALITRMGEGSKLVLIGDLEQIDSLDIDEATSGLANTIEIFKSFKGAAHLSLRKGERSALANFAAENM